MTTRRSRLTYANVASTLALCISLSGGVAYASHLKVYSADIVDGQVKRLDLAANVVNGGRVENGSLSGADLKDGSLSGVDLKNGSVTSIDIADRSITGNDIDFFSINGTNIDQDSLTEIDAALIDGMEPHHLIRIGGVSKRAAEDMPDCTTGLEYLSYTFTAPVPGLVLVNAGFTASNGNFGPSAFAARIDRTSPGLLVGEWMEDNFDAANGRYSLPVTQTFSAPAGPNTYVLRVCDGSSAPGANGTARAAQMTLVFSPFFLS